MSTTYSTATKSTQTQFDDLLRARFAELADAGLTVSLVMAANPDTDPVKCFGLPSPAKSKVNGLQQRIEGLADVTITIDDGRWDKMTPNQRLATLERELTKVELSRDDAGQLVKDDADRPKCKLLPPDFVAAGFDSVVQQYGKDAIEYQAVRAIATRWVQMKLWGQDL